MAAIQVGTGATLTFGTSTWTGDLTSISWGGISRPSLDTTHLGTTDARTFIPGDLFDPGELTVEFLFDTDSEPPYTASPETITLTFPDSDAASGAGATAAASGFITSFEVNNPLEEVITATMTIKFTGDITWSDET